jgi:membrane protease subunit (stomatin/prohibitin family)
MPLRRARGLARTVGRTAVIAGTATAVSGHVANRQAARAQQDQAQQDQAQAPAAPAADQVDVVDQLKRFAELRDQGILTEEEFAAQKAKLLGS